MNTDALFCYGSLMDGDVLKLVLAGEIDAVDTRPAQLAGYRCVQLIDETFPILQTQVGGLVDGLLLTGLSDLAWQRIGFFEGEEYEMQWCTVSTDTGRFEARYCADVTCPEQVLGSWTLADWQQRHKADFCVQTARYMTLFGQMSAAEADAHWIAGRAAAIAEPAA